MKMIKAKLVLFAIIGLLGVSCEEDQINDASNAQNTNIETLPEAIDDGATTQNIYTKVAIVQSAHKGKIGQLLDLHDVEQYEINADVPRFEPQTGFIYIDADLTVDAESIITVAEENNLNFIIESGSGNLEKLAAFNEVFGISETFEGLFIFNNGRRNDFVPVDHKKLNFNAEDAFSVFFGDYLPQKEEFETPVQPEQNTVTPTEGPSFQAKETYNYTNITHSSALSRAKKKFGGGSACSWSLNKSSTSGVSARQTSVSRTASDDWLVKGSQHNAKGKCRSQQTASYSKSLSYSKTWSVAVGGKVEVQSGLIKLGLSASTSYGNGVTRGATDGTSLKMRKEWAQGGVVQRVKYHQGVLNGKQVIEWKVSCKGESKSETVIVNINHSNNPYATWQPTSKEFFRWAEWGKLLRKCK